MAWAVEERGTTATTYQVRVPSTGKSHDDGHHFQSETREAATCVAARSGQVTS